MTPALQRLRPRQRRPVAFVAQPHRPVFDRGEHALECLIEPVVARRHRTVRVDRGVTQSVGLRNCLAARLDRVIELLQLRNLQTASILQRSAVARRGDARAADVEVGELLQPLPRAVPT